MTYTLIFIAFFSTGTSVLTQSGFASMDECNKAANVMVDRFNVYEQGKTRVEWVCK